ncbi:hypothetical protein [Nocardioides pacificus]
MNDEPIGAAEAIRGHIREAGFRRVGHGLYLPHVAGSTPEEELIRDLKAWALVLPGGAVFTHLTAAQLLGWSMPRLPEYVPVFAATQYDDPRPRRPALICSRLTRAAEIHHHRGVPIDSAEEILLRAARDLSLLDLIVLVDAALHAGHTTAKRLLILCNTAPRPGVRRLRAAVRLSDGRAESPWETLLRVFHVLMRIAVEPQFEVFDDDGLFIARADLLVVGTWFLHEYDGGVHRDADVQANDLRRERRLAGTPYRRRAFTADELLNRPLLVLREIDQALGRKHVPTRVHRWRRLVAESCWSPAGRARLENRWRKVNGVPDWAETA